ncbi:MAG: Ger(x)C family spore germination protein [Candidatus Syntrophonatronum acetioxidans]|uniref:Ger(X)C family spore germination protein n=1 Tax=Candidatus Syntrophonatronum acetioxidans TaxID=1795816 RepID=A0A424Y9G8_9FIRM|nr:MAG: Ger(x)C family spore germination protein [Candidatus Syntrophonatronum acetioxidans]
MNLPSKGFLVILILILFINNTGCWNRVEPEDLTLVLMMGIEREEEKGDMKLTVQAANPMQGGAEEEGDSGNQEKPYWVVSATGPTLRAAVKNLNKKSTREINLTHMEILLLSEELAREGIEPVLDFLQRGRESRFIIQPMVVEGDLGKAMKGEYETEDLGAMAISRQHQVVLDELAATIDYPLRIMFNRLSQPGCEILLPRLKVMELEGGELSPVSPLEVDGAAAFYRDRMVGWLNDKETRGYNWVINDINRPVYVFESPAHPEREVTVEIFQSSSNLEARVQGEEVHIRVSVIAEGRIQETTSPEEKLSGETETADSLNRRLAQAVRNDIQAALDKGQEALKSDIFGFGNLIYRTLPRKWEKMEDDWFDHYPEVQVEILVEADVRRTGLVKDPLEIK